MLVPRTIHWIIMSVTLTSVSAVHPRGAQGDQKETGAWKVCYSQITNVYINMVGLVNQRDCICCCVSRATRGQRAYWGCWFTRTSWNEWPLWV